MIDRVAEFAVRAGKWVDGGARDPSLDTIDAEFLPASTADLLSLRRRPGEPLEKAVNRALKIAVHQTRFSRRGWIRTLPSAPSPKGPMPLAGCTSFFGMTAVFPDGSRYSIPNPACSSGGGRPGLGGLKRCRTQPRDRESLERIEISRRVRFAMAGLRHSLFVGGAAGPADDHAQTGAVDQLVALSDPLANFDPADLDGIKPVPIQASPGTNIGEFRIVGAGENHGGVGLVVGPAHLLTSAHVVWHETENKSVFEVPNVSERFTPGQTPALESTYDCLFAFFDSRWLVTPYEPDFDLAMVVLEDNPTTASADWFWIWYDQPESVYEPRPLCLFGYPDASLLCKNTIIDLEDDREDNDTITSGHCYQSWGEFKGYQSADIAVYGNLACSGFSGGRVAAFPGGLPGTQGLGHLSFVHGGRPAGVAPEDVTDSRGVRFNAAKEETVRIAACMTHPWLCG